MLGLMQYPQRVLLHKQQKRPRTFLAILKYVAAQQPTDRQFRNSNRPIRCSTQLSRYYGRYHEQPGPPPPSPCGLQKKLLETLNNVGRRTRCPQPLTFVRPTVSYIVQCRRNDFFKTTLCKGGGPGHL